MHGIVDEPDEAPDGLVIATGFHAGGIMTSPAIDAGVWALVTGEAAPLPLNTFALDRFESRSPEFPFRPHMVDDETPVEGSWTGN